MPLIIRDELFPRVFVPHFVHAVVRVVRCGTTATTTTTNATITAAAAAICRHVSCGVINAPNSHCCRVVVTRATRTPPTARHSPQIVPLRRP